jgi:hypothetical protein
MMTGNDLKKALNIVLERTMRPYGDMPWSRAVESSNRIELVSNGIPGYLIKVIEQGRNYEARIAEVSPDGRPHVVGATNDRMSPDDRSEIERLAFAIFREAIDRAESRALQDFEAAASRGQPTFVEEGEAAFVESGERDIEF